MTEPKVYRPRRARGVSVLVVGMYFMGLGLLVLDAVGWGAWYWWATFLILGTIAVGGGAELLGRRVVVDDGGLAKCCWFGNGPRASWHDMESWLVAP
jgi:hypothetical protein